MSLPRDDLAPIGVFLLLAAAPVVFLVMAIRHTDAHWEALLALLHDKAAFVPPIKAR